MTRQTALRGWAAYFVLPCLCLGLGCTRAEPEPRRASGETLVERIVSFSPSTTEILFALEQGDRVVGVTRYCDYPAKAREIIKVGGYVDPNYEAIVALRPDLTILLTSHHEAQTELEKLGLKTLITPHETVGDIYEAIRIIGRACDAEEHADAMVADMRRRARAVSQSTSEEGRPRVLICIGRDTESGELSGMYMAGRHGFYDEIIEMAGGINAYEDTEVAFPQLSAEGVIRLNPDVIVDLVSSLPSGIESRQAIEQHWSRLRTVPAVRRGRVHLIVGNHALRPGPRSIDFLEELARLLHPDVFSTSAAHD